MGFGGQAVVGVEEPAAVWVGGWVGVGFHCRPCDRALLKDYYNLGFSAVLSLASHSLQTFSLLLTFQLHISPPAVSNLPSRILSLCSVFLRCL